VSWPATYEGVARTLFVAARRLRSTQRSCGPLLGTNQQGCGRPPWALHRDAQSRPLRVLAMPRVRWALIQTFAPLQMSLPRRPCNHAALGWLSRSPWDLSRGQTGLASPRIPHSRRHISSKYIVAPPASCVSILVATEIFPGDQDKTWPVGDSLFKRHGQSAFSAPVGTMAQLTWRLMADQLPAGLRQLPLPHTLAKYPLLHTAPSEELRLQKRRAADA